MLLLGFNYSLGLTQRVNLAPKSELFKAHKIKELNLMTPNRHCTGRTAPQTSRRCILNIFSTNIRTEYFKHTA
jgi:hypothetical protein